MEVSSDQTLPRKPVEGLQAWRSSLSKPVRPPDSPQRSIGSYASHKSHVSQSSSAPLLTIKDLSTKLFQVDKVVADLQRSFDQLRLEVGAATTTFRFSGTGGSANFSPLDGAGVAREGSSIELSSNALASAGESRTGVDAAPWSARLLVLEAVCEDLRHGLDGLQERVSFPEATEGLVRTELEQFRAELEEKLKHLAPSNFGTKEWNRDVAAPLDAAKQESLTAPGVDHVSETVTSVYVILRTEVMQEVGQLRSFIESEVRSLRSHFEVESAKVEKNVVTLCGFEATNTWLCQRMEEISQSFTKLQETGIRCGSEVSELRSRLEVVVRECDEHISKEQSRRANQTVASADEKGLSVRLLRLEKACQQAIAMPSVVLDTTESLRAELRQVVNPLREDMDCLKRAMDASSHRNENEFGDAAESRDPERCSSPYDLASLHRRLLDLEAAHAADSKKLEEFEQHRGTMGQCLSQEMQSTWAIVNSQVALVTQSVELLQKQHAVMQERISNLTDSVAHACTARQLVGTSGGQQQQQLRHQTPQMETESMKGGLRSNSLSVCAPSPEMTAVSHSQTLVPRSSGPPSGGPPSGGASVSTPVPASWSSGLLQESRLEHAVARLDELSDEMRAERAKQVVLAEKWVAATEAAFSADLNSVREMVVGTLMKRISALESMMTRQISSTNLLGKKQAQSPLPVTFQADSAFASDSRPMVALEAEPNDLTATGKAVKAAGASPKLSLQACPRPSLQAMAAAVSASMPGISGIRTSVKPSWKATAASVSAAKPADSELSPGPSLKPMAASAGSAVIPSDAGIRLSPRSTLRAMAASVALADTGTPALSKAVVRIHSLDNVRNRSNHYRARETVHGSVAIPMAQQNMRATIRRLQATHTTPAHHGASPSLDLQLPSAALATRRVPALSLIAGSENPNLPSPRRENAMS